MKNYQELKEAVLEAREQGLEMVGANVEKLVRLMNELRQSTIHGKVTNKQAHELWTLLGQV